MKRRRGEEGVEHEKGKDQSQLRRIESAKLRHTRVDERALRPPQLFTRVSIPASHTLAHLLADLGRPMSALRRNDEVSAPRTG